MTKIKNQDSGKLRIGDHWNAITIIALSQNNPLKAIAEFVENSIDAEAKNVTIVRGKTKNEQYLKISDDGKGIDDLGYVATHIGDSIKRQLKKRGEKGIQGEFGIGLLSFWTVGETLNLTSRGSDGQTRTMKLVKGDPSYAIRDSGLLMEKPGTELLVSPILPGVRLLSGEKIQNFLASELRDRIIKSGINIRIVDHGSRLDLLVKPRSFKGILIHGLPEPKSPHGEIYLELYFCEPSPESTIGLYKQGTRVISDITRLDHFSKAPWNSRYIEGLIDSPFLQLTPGTRDGVIQDAAFDSLCIALEEIEEKLLSMLEERKKAEEEKASKQILNKLAKAFREAFLRLPDEEYGWLAARVREKRADGDKKAKTMIPVEADGIHQRDKISDAETGADNPEVFGETDAYLGEHIAEEKAGSQKEFFDYAGPLHKLMIAPQVSVIAISSSKKLKALARDKVGRLIDSGLTYKWRIMDGAGSLSVTDGAFTQYDASEDPGLVYIELRAKQEENLLVANAVITVTAELAHKSQGSANKKGLPGYTYKRAPGELWRSRYCPDQSLIYINNGHADFVYASRHASSKLRYITRLFAKELVLANFPEADKEEILERLVELSLYTEENL